MSAEVDALIIRSLSELNEAATRLAALSDEIGESIDAQIGDWITRHEWKGVAGRYSGGPSTYLGPQAWFLPDDPRDRAHLYFIFAPAIADVDVAELVSLVGAGAERMGFWLAYDILKVSPFKKLWRAFLAENSDLPVDSKGQLFIPVKIDPEALAVAVIEQSINDALDPLRDALSRLPEIAERLGPLQKAIEAAAR